MRNADCGMRLKEREPAGNRATCGQRKLRVPRRFDIPQSAIRDAQS